MRGVPCQWVKEGSEYILLDGDYHAMCIKLVSIKSPCSLTVCPYKKTS